MRVIHLTVVILLTLRVASAQWFVAKSPHFEVYSDAGPEAAKRTLSRFEELRSFFDHYQVIQTNSATRQRPPIRVIAFKSRAEYSDVRVRPTADAFYTGTEDRDYIVMPLLESQGNFGIAAHEYAHAVLYSRNLKLPSWLSEGIAELFSTVAITNHGCQFGGPIRAHLDILRRQHWLTADELFAARSKDHTTRDQAALFYAESWAVTDMLTSSPAYAAQFAKVIAALTREDADSSQELARIYARSADAVLTDARAWVSHARSSRRALPPLSALPQSSNAQPVSQRESRTLLADLLFATGDWTRSQRAYQELLRESPNDPDLLAALGTLELRQNNKPEAAKYFHRALDNHLNNAALCYRYALLADDLSSPSEEIERALERAIAIQPDFDDARYKLALMESNESRFADAVVNLQAMDKPTGPRAFAYWEAMAFALSELGRRDEAKTAANQALHFATTAEDRARARELGYIAGTDMTVRFTRDANGNLQLVTTRVPHGTTNFNPFVEPGDHIATANGELKEIQCKEGRLTGLLVESEGTVLTLSVPDPLHVMIRNGPPQFFCGPQGATAVTVEYATAAAPGGGLLRGMDFH